LVDRQSLKKSDLKAPWFKKIQIKKKKVPKVHLKILVDRQSVNQGAQMAPCFTKIQIKKNLGAEWAPKFFNCFVKKPCFGPKSTCFQVFFTKLGTPGNFIPFGTFLRDWPYFQKKRRQIFIFQKTNYAN